MRSEEAKLEPKLGTNLQPVGLCGVPFHQLQEQAAKELGPKPTQQARILTHCLCPFDFLWPKETKFLPKRMYSVYNH